MTDYTTTDATRQPGLGERVAELLPGTVEHAQKHGLPHDPAQQSLGATVASYIPGTVEYREGVNTEQGTTGTQPTTTHATSGTAHTDDAPLRSPATHASTGTAHSDTTPITSTGATGYTTGDNTGPYDADNYVTGKPGNPAGYGTTTGTRTGGGLADLTDVRESLPTEEGYTGSRTTDTTTEGRPTTGERIKSNIPGTDEYQAKHGYDRNQERAENVKGYIPGTEEHREKKAAQDITGTGYTDTGATGYTGTDVNRGGISDSAYTPSGTYSGTGDVVGSGTDYTGTSATSDTTREQRPGIGEKIKAAIPGTEEYQAKHGYDRNQERAENVKSYIPGTEERQAKKAAENIEYTGTGYDASRTTDYTGTGTDYATTGAATGTGYTGVTSTDYTSTGATTDTTREQRPGIGERIKAAIPGTEEYQATHGHDRKQERAEDMKSHIPGTEEHRERKAYEGTSMTGPDTHLAGGFGTGGLAAQYQEPTYQGVPLTRVEGDSYATGEHTGVAGTGVGSATEGMSMGEKIKSKIPGTEEYVEVHGADRRHEQAENLKAKIPGTDEHKARKAGETDVGYGTTGAYNTTPATGAYDTTPATGAYDTTPATGAYDTTPTTEAYDTTRDTSRATGAYEGTPGTYDTTPGTGAYDSVPGTTGYGDAGTSATTDIVGGPAVGGGSYTEGTTAATDFDAGVGRASDAPAVGGVGYDTTTGAGYDSTTYGTTGATTGYDAGASYDQTSDKEKEGLGHKILKHVPGTQARKEYKAEKAAATSEGVY